MALSRLSLNSLSLSNATLLAIDFKTDSPKYDSGALQHDAGICIIIVAMLSYVSSVSGSLYCATIVVTKLSKPSGVVGRLIKGSWVGDCLKPNMFLLSV